MESIQYVSLCKALYQQITYVTYKAKYLQYLLNYKCMLNFFIQNMICSLKNKYFHYKQLLNLYIIIKS